MIKQRVKGSCVIELVNRIVRDLTHGLVGHLRYYGNIWYFAQMCHSWSCPPDLISTDWCCLVQPMTIVNCGLGALRFLVMSFGILIEPASWCCIVWKTLYTLSCKKAAMWANNHCELWSTTTPSSWVSAGVLGRTALFDESLATLRHDLIDVL